MSSAEHVVPSERAWTQRSPSVSAPPRKPSRRLKPEVVAKLRDRRSETPVQQLYEKPVHELSPEEIAVMRAAFFRG